MFSKAKPKPQALPTVPTDTVIPFHHFDDQFYARALVLHFFYRFDDVLDADKLKSALERLMRIGGWRKLGARPRLNVSRRAHVLHMAGCWLSSLRLPGGWQVGVSSPGVLHGGEAWLRLLPCGYWDRY